MVVVAEGVKRLWEWCVRSCCTFIYWPDVYFFSLFTCFFKVCLVSPTTLSKAATLSNVCVPLLLVQTGYYEFPKSGSILTQATLIILIVICLDLHHIPHKQYCMQMYDLFSYSCFIVWAMKHECCSHSLWWKYFPTRPFHSQMLAFPFLLFCRVNQVWKMHFCLAFNLVYITKQPVLTTSCQITVSSSDAAQASHFTIKVQLCEAAPVHYV